MILEAAAARPDSTALVHGDQCLSYEQLAEATEAAARGLLRLGLKRGDRVAVYLEKRFETVIAMFAAAAAGLAFVPVNPQLKADQVGHILRDCAVRVLVTTASRHAALGDVAAECADLSAVVLVPEKPGPEKPGPEKTGIGGPEGERAVSWEALAAEGQGGRVQPHPAIAGDMAAILYTSGSTGLPKGVVLSHHNLILGAQSVASYLRNTAEDRILSVLPLSFDAGLSQVTTAVSSGARLILMNYLLPRDVVRLCEKHRVTGLTAVPPLWIPLSGLEWPEAAASHLRYFANTGGHMPRATLERLRACFPSAKPFLMYGLTEAFRSTYLDPRQVDNRPDSIGKAIPNAEILVLREDGSICDDEEPGELVHRGPLVAMGYWNDTERTAARFRPIPPRSSGLTREEIAVWSGDRVRRDSEGYLYFLGRADDMIKTSGYRVSPTEIEEVAYASGLVGEAVALGRPHDVLGQAIVLLVAPAKDEPVDGESLLAEYRRRLPGFMVPQEIIERSALPRNQNGKFDRAALAKELSQSEGET